MRELIAANKRKSWLLMIGFLVVIALLGWFISYYVQDQYPFLVIAIFFGGVSVLTSYFAGDKLVLRSVGAVPIVKSDDPELYRIVENLAITAGIPTPQIYLVPDPAFNAFATGRDPQHASVAITVGLRRWLDKNELEAVMGHELSHIKEYDIRLMLLAAVLVGTILFLADILWRVSLGGSNDRERGNVLLLPALLVGLIVAPLAAQIIKLAISRRREYLADAGSVLLTRYPEAMISALEKISQAPTLQAPHQAIAHLFIYPPEKTNFLSRLLSTHPPIQDRINAIKRAARLA